MNTAVVNVKVDPLVKRQAQKTAHELGFSLSALVNGFLKQLIKTKAVTFGAISEEPTEYMLQALKESRENIKAGRISPAFADAKEAIAWLNRKDKSYARQVFKKIR